jgi:hypothetical protein
MTIVVDGVAKNVVHLGWPHTRRKRAGEVGGYREGLDDNSKD